MKNISILFLILVSVFSCKKDIGKNKTQAKNEAIVHVDSVNNIVRDSIEIFIIDLANTKPELSKELLTLNENLSEFFEDYSKKMSLGTLKEYLRDIKEEEIPKVLSRDLENPNFTKAKSIQVSFLSKKEEGQQGEIIVEEWQFESEKEAVSCINSFKNYKGQPIHYKATNWIWVQQKNKLYFISTIEFRSSAKPMQQIKKELLSILEKNGSYLEQDI